MKKFKIHHTEEFDNLARELISILGMEVEILKLEEVNPRGKLTGTFTLTIRIKQYGDIVYAYEYSFPVNNFDIIREIKLFEL